MKIAVCFLFIVAGASALPTNANSEFEETEQRIVTNIIRNAIERIRQAIRDNNLDPFILENFEYEYNIPFLVNVKAFVDQFFFYGTSNILIRQLDYNIFSNRLRFNLELQQLNFGVVDSGVSIDAFGSKVDGKLNGVLIIEGIGLSGEIRFNLSIISGISIRSLSTQFRVRNIKSYINLIINNNDFSDGVNNLLNNDIPEYLKNYESEINKLVTDSIRAILDAVLKPNAYEIEALNSFLRGSKRLLN